MGIYIRLKKRLYNVLAARTCFCVVGESLIVLPTLTHAGQVPTGT